MKWYAKIWNYVVTIIRSSPVSIRVNTYPVTMFQWAQKHYWILNKRRFWRFPAPKEPKFVVFKTKIVFNWQFCTKNVQDLHKVDEKFRNATRKFVWRQQFFSSDLHCWIQATQKQLSINSADCVIRFQFTRSFFFIINKQSNARKIPKVIMIGLKFFIIIIFLQINNHLSKKSIKPSHFFVQKNGMDAPIIVCIFGSNLDIGTCSSAQAGYHTTTLHRNR